MIVFIKCFFICDFKIKSINKLIFDIVFWDGLDFKNFSIVDILLVLYFFVNFVVFEV